MEYDGACGYDYLKIYDGPHTNSYRKATLCDFGYYELISTTNSLYLEFKSDTSTGYSGFQLVFSLKGI